MTYLALAVLLAAVFTLGVAFASDRYEPKGGWPQPDPDEGMSEPNQPTHAGVPPAIITIALAVALAVWTLVS